MNRQPPPFDAIPAAWASLPADAQANLGCMLIEYVFADFVSGEAYSAHDQYCTDGIRNEAAGRRDEVLNTMMPMVMDHLPDLFGGEEQDPPWAWRGTEEYDAAIKADLREIADKQAGVDRMWLAAAMQRDRDEGGRA